MSDENGTQQALRDHHRRRRPGGPDGRAVRGPLPDPDARARAGHPRRPALEHRRGRGLPGLRAHHGPRPGRPDPEARREVRRDVRDRRRGRRRSRSTATTASCATADGREFRAPAVIVTAGGDARKLGVPGRGGAGRQGRLLLRGLRRRVLRGRRHRGRRRRRLRRRGGHVPDPLRQQGLRDPPPRRIPRAADPGRADARHRQGGRGDEHGRRRDPRHRRPRVPRDACATSTPTSARSCPVGAVFPFVGFTPHSDIFDPDLAVQIELDESGHIVTDQAMRTAVPGHLRGRRRALPVRPPDHQRGRRRDHGGAGRAPVRRAPEARALEADRLV